ncbi:MAG TPA: integrase arm-type DNA-binding domain-containing protein [Rhizomicrobium sp.]|jgi:nucleotide-binding universal stress UspA family protein|nr:integrase arm-type DNA-binding domain-containing protein [Rhizomicrobium sp.]
MDALLPGQTLFDTEVRGFVARRLSSGKITFGLKYSESGSGSQRWFALGVMDGAFTAEKARQAAILARGRIVEGRDPQAERVAARRKRELPNTLNRLLDDHLRLYVVANGLRSAKEIERCFEKYVRPTLGGVPTSDLRRSHVVSLLDDIATNNGPVMADRVLAHLRKALNWYAARDDAFHVPIVPGMTHTKPRERARDRVLSDDEIRIPWEATASDSLGTFGALVRMLLLWGVSRRAIRALCVFLSVDFVVQCARLHDLTIVPVPDYVSLDELVVEDLIFGTGRPAILLPAYEGAPKYEASLDRIVVAWDFSRAASRALADAMPLLKKAKKVSVLTVRGEKDIPDSMSQTDLYRHLQMHGVIADIDEVSAGGVTIGDAMMDNISARRANMLVMGAFGHSRLREFVLGGASRAMISKPPIPIFMSH